MKRFLLPLAFGLVLASCAGTRGVSYTVARHYFVNNNAPALTSPIISSEAEFQKYFGMAAVMGRGGLPTAIDFARQCVVAKVLPETNVATELTPLSLKQTGPSQLTLRYRIKRGERRSYTTQPMFLLCVPAKYKGYSVVEQQEP